MSTYVICAQCGVGKRFATNRHRIFCGSVCYLAHREANQIPKRPRECERCSRVFRVWPGATQRFCSPECKFPPLAERLWSRVDKTAPAPAHRPDLGACWVWTGSTKGGYGHISVPPGARRGRSSTRATHIVAYELANGPVPDKAWVLHACDNPPCCNPAHLFLGDHAANTADMVSKGRQRGAVGTRNTRALLTESDVLAIRRAYANGGRQRDIGRAFGVGKTTVAHVVNMDTWRHVEDVQ